MFVRSHSLLRVGRKLILLISVFCETWKVGVGNGGDVPAIGALHGERGGGKPRQRPSHRNGAFFHSKAGHHTLIDAIFSGLSLTRLSALQMLARGTSGTAWSQTAVSESSSLPVTCARKRQRSRSTRYDHFR